MSKVSCHPKTQEVLVQDQFTEIINLYFSRLIQEITIVTNTSIDDSIITISCSSTPTVGNLVCLKENQAFYQGEIVASTPNGVNFDITLDIPLDYAYTTNGGCSERSHKLNVDGSVTPIEFTISPTGLTNVGWDVYGVTGTMMDNVDMDDHKFGGITRLDKGIVLRLKNGVTKNFFNAKDNEGLKLNADVKYSTKAPSGLYGMKYHYDIKEENGVSVRLNSNDGDELVLIVQDDLTDLYSFYKKMHGHVIN